MRLESKVALITGAARGIGEAIAKAYAAMQQVQLPEMQFRTDLGHRAAGHSGSPA